jgi:hypothetical protein
MMFWGNLCVILFFSKKEMKKEYQNKCEYDSECGHNLKCLKSHGTTDITCLCENTKHWNGETCGK